MKVILILYWKLECCLGESNDGSDYDDDDEEDDDDENNNDDNDYEDDDYDEEESFDHNNNYRNKEVNKIIKFEVRNLSLNLSLKQY